jgi:hypothetical protein
MVYDLVFTSDRVLVISIRHPGDLQNSVSWQTFLFGSWISRRTEQFEQDKLADQRHNQTHHLTPSELLAQNPRNFEISKNTINSIKITHKLFQWQLVFHVSHPETVRRTRFSLSQIQASEARRLADLFLPSQSSE